MRLLLSPRNSAFAFLTSWSLIVFLNHTIPFIKHYYRTSYVTMLIRNAFRRKNLSTLILKSLTPYGKFKNPSPTLAYQRLVIPLFFNKSIRLDWDILNQIRNKRVLARKPKLFSMLTHKDASCMHMRSLCFLNLRYDNKNIKAY
jgi:hypothetical protein